MTSRELKLREVREKLDETLNSDVRRVVENSGGSGRWGVMSCWSGHQ